MMLMVLLDTYFKLVYFNKNMAKRQLNKGVSRKQLMCQFFCGFFHGWFGTIAIGPCLWKGAIELCMLLMYVLHFKFMG